MLISQRIVHIAHILYPYNSAKRLNCITTLATAIAKARQDVVISLDDDFNPNQHPRNKNDGRFISKNEAKDITHLLGKEIKGVKGRQAIDALVQNEGGYVKSAFYVNKIGDIDLFWGDSSCGLKHIIERRQERGDDINDLFNNLSNVINTGKVIEKQDEYEEKRFIISKGIYRAVISTELRGNKLNYVLTAFMIW